MPLPGSSPFRPLLPWVCFVTLAYLLNCVGRSIFGPLLPSIEGEFNISHSLATSILLWVAGGFCIGLFFSNFTLGLVTPRRQVALSLVTAGFFLALTPLTSGILGLKILALCFGFCAGMYTTGGIATLQSLVDYGNWGTAMGIHQMAPHLSFICAPLLATLFLDFLPWRYCIALAGCFCIVGGILFGLFARGGNQRPQRTSFRGVGEILREPAAIIIAIWMFMGMSGEFSVFSVLPLYFTSELGLTQEGANVLLSITRLFSPVCVLIGGIVSDRISAGKVVVFFLIFHAAALWLLSSHSLPLAIIGCTFQGGVAALAAPSTYKLLARHFPAAQQPVFLASFMPLASLVAVGIIPRIFGWAGDNFSFAAAFRFYGLFSLSLLILFLFFPKTKPST